MKCHQCGMDNDPEAAACSACGTELSGLVLSTLPEGFLSRGDESLVNALIETLAPRYDGLEPIGKGGFAYVFKLRDTELERDVAVKVLRPDLAKDETFIERFLFEARTSAKLAHPNIVTIFDFGRLDSTIYFIMEYLDGRTLTRVLEGRDRLETHEIIPIAADIARAMAFAHSHGVVHRDLKPENIIITTRGKAVVTDFGIARALGASRITASGTFVGTAHYMSPEQGRGQSVDERSDIYSLGVILYEMVAGRVPFEGEDSVGIIYQHVHEPVPPLEDVPGVSQELIRIINKAMAKRPEDRYQTADEVLRDLVALAETREAGKESEKPDSQGEARRQRYDTNRHQRVLRDLLTDIRTAARKKPRKDPASRVSRVHRTEVLLDRAAAQLRRGRTTEALKVLEEVAERRPGNNQLDELRRKAEQQRSDSKREAQRLYKLGIEEFDKEDYGESIRLWGRVLAIEPDRTDVHDLIAEAKHRRAEQLRQAAVLDKTDSGLQAPDIADGELVVDEAWLAEDDENLGSQDDLSPVAGVIGGVPPSVEESIELADRLLDQGDILGAAEASARALEIDPHSAAAQQMLAKIQEKGAQLQQISLLLDAARRAETKGNIDSALEHVAAALDLSPDNEEALELRARLEVLARALAQPEPAPEKSETPSAEPPRAEAPGQPAHATPVAPTDENAELPDDEPDESSDDGWAPPELPVRLRSASPRRGPRSMLVAAGLVGLVFLGLAWLLAGHRASDTSPERPLSAAARPTDRPAATPPPSPDQTPRVRPTATPATTATLTVHLEEPVEIAVDGRSLGRFEGEAELSLDAGRHRVVLTNGSGQTIERSVELSPGEVKSLTLAFKPVGTLIITAPVGSDIYLGHRKLRPGPKVRATTSMDLQTVTVEGVEVGRQEVRILQAGQPPQSKRVRIRAGKSSTVVF